MYIVHGGERKVKIKITENISHISSPSLVKEKKIICGKRDKINKI